MLRLEEVYKLEAFGREIEQLINARGIDAILGMPDYLIREYLVEQLKTLQDIKAKWENF